MKGRHVAAIALALIAGGVLAIGAAILAPRYPIATEAAGLGLATGSLMAAAGLLRLAATRAGDTRRARRYVRQITGRR